MDECNHYKKLLSQIWDVCMVADSQVTSNLIQEIVEVFGWLMLSLMSILN